MEPLPGRQDARDRRERPALPRGSRRAVLPSAQHIGMTQFVNANVESMMFTEIYTDGHAAYQKLRTFHHETVNHTDKEYVKGEDIHTNGIESFWAELKRGIMGTYHYVSPKHTHRYATEFEGRRNSISSDMGTMEKVQDVMSKAPGKRLPVRSWLAGAVTPPRGNPDSGDRLTEPLATGRTSSARRKSERERSSPTGRPDGHRTSPNNDKGR